MARRWRVSLGLLLGVLALALPAQAAITNIDQWDVRTNALGNVQEGGSLTATSNSQVLFLLRGLPTPNFDQYNVGGNNWSGKANTPMPVGPGATLGYPLSGSYVYAFKGSDISFWRYDMGANTWAYVASASANVSPGAALVSTGDEYLYAFRGGGSTDFWRYNINTDSWNTLAAAPVAVSQGATLVYPGTGYFLYATMGDNTTSFYRYNIVENVWESRASTLGAISGGATMAYPASGSHLFLLRAGGTTNLDRYDFLSDSWTAMTAAPGPIGQGAGMAYPGMGDYLYASVGNNANAFNYYSTFYANQHPPVTPTNVTPTSGSTGVSLAPSLVSSAYSDSESALSPYQNSWWQVSLSPSFNTTVWDSLSASGPVTTMPVGVTLSPSTTYYWRVTHMDSTNRWSNWSHPTPFTTGVGAPPVIGTLNDGPVLSEDISVQASPNGLQASWALASGGVSEYSVSVGTSPGATDVVTSMSVGVQTTVFISPSAMLANGQIYYVNVAARDASVMGALASSNGVTVTFPTLSSSENLGIDQWNGDVPGAVFGNNAGGGADMTYPGAGDFLYHTFGSNINLTSKYSLSGDTYASTTAAPSNATTGGIYTYAGSQDYLYHFPGLSTNFERYRISTDSWSNMPVSAPCTVGAGSAAGYSLASGQYLYLWCGNGSQALHRYDLSASSWTALGNSPGPPGAGAGLYWSPLSPDIFIAARGGGASNAVDRYVISTNQWIGIPGAPGNIGNGSQGWVTGNGKYLYLTQGNASQGFYRYDFLANNWTTLSNVPGVVNGGGMGAYVPGVEMLYVPRGADKTVYRYSLVKDKWDTGLEPPPSGAVGAGAGLAYSASAGLLYALRGGSTNNFYEYNIAANTWATKATLPVSAGAGGALVAGQGDSLYALAGNSTSNFYQYSTSTNTWNAKASVPSTVGSASGMAYVSTSNQLFTFRGLGSTPFYRYNVDNDTWSTLTSAPLAVDLGASLVYPGTGDCLYGERGNASTTFWRYCMSSNAWTSMANLPTTVQQGAALVYPGRGDFIYLQRGQTSNQFFKYSITSDSWSISTAMPEAADTGGALTYPGSGDYLYEVPGNNSAAFRRFSVFFTGQHPPDTPLNSTPTSASAATSAPVTLTAGAYNDPDSDAHTQSQFAVATAPGFTSSEVIYNSGAVAATTSHNVTLTPSALAYYWRVRYKDADGEWSNWSHPTPFFVVHYPAGTNLTADAHGTYGGIFADVNGDGFQDYIAVNKPTAANRVYLNDGTGAFPAGANLTADAHTSEDVAAGDVDGDGDLDLVVANSSAQANRLYRNDGAGNFTGEDITADAHNSTAIALGDVDKDGDLDVVVGNGAQTLRLYLNNGLGVFGAGADVSADANDTNDIALGDLDGDGDLDLVVGNWNQADRVYLNNGNGTFAAGADVSADMLKDWSMTLGDVNADGYLDLVIVTELQNKRLYTGNGNGTFAAGVNLTAETYDHTSSALGDVDGDGDLDLIAGIYSGNTRLYTNDGTGAFTYDSNLAADSLQTQALAFGDVDGDGLLDVGAGEDAQANRLYLNGSPLTNTAPPTPTMTAEPDALSGSVNLQWASGGADDHTPANLITYNLRVGITPGGKEIMSSKIPAGPGNVGQSLSWSLNLSASTGTRTYYWSVQAIDTTGFLSSSFAAEDSFVISQGAFVSVWTSTETDNTRSVAWGDYDGDGDLDQLVGDWGQANRVYRNDGGGSFTLVWSSTETDQTNSLAWGDYDGDGDLDQLAGNNTQANRVYRNDGGSSFTLVWSSTETDQTNSVAWGDYDGDGDLDQLAGNFSEANRIYRNDGGGSFTLVWSSAENDATFLVAWGDYDGDGDLDQLVGNENQANRVYRNNGGGSFTLVWSSTETDATRSLAWGDYDGDGDLDQLAGNVNQANRVYRNDGGGSFTLVWSSTETDDTRSVAWGDYDGDGDLDQSVGNDSSQANRVYRNDGGSSFALVWSSTATDNTRSLAWGDYDGDGDLDQLVGNLLQANRLYQNYVNPGNTAPPPPTITAEPDGLSGSVKLEWASGGADDHTPANLITYNLRVGITPGGREIMSTKIPAGPGNVGQSLSWSLNLSASTGSRTYYWSVQALDNTGFLSSSFAAEDSFDISQGAFVSVWASGETEATRGAAWGDTDGDGDLDLLAANFSGQVDRVYRNDGGDTFTSVFTTPQTDGAYSGVMGDYDNDGDLDLLVGNDGVPNRVYRNDGGNTFTLAWSDASSYTWSVAAWADVDNDGDLDFAIGGFSGQVKKVFRNDGGDTFTQAWTSPEADNTLSLAWGDSDGDGDMDLLVGNAANNRLYRNDWLVSGSLSLVWTSTESDDTTSVAWGDYDGDGDLDQLVGNGSSQANRVYRNDGGNAFSLQWTSPQTDYTYAAQWGDFDGDGDLDQFVTNNAAPNRVYRNDGGGTFVLAWSATASAADFDVALGDYDGDGDMDFYTAGYNQANRVYRNNLNPSNTAPPAPTLTAEPDSVSGSVKLEWASGGADDHTPAALITYNLRVGTSPGGREIMSTKIPAGPGNVGQSLSWSLNLSASTGSRTYYWSVQAIDNTGFLSSSFAAEDSFTLQDNFSLVWSSGDTDNHWGMALGDTDGDGDLDVLVGNNTQSNRLYRNDGGNTFTSVWTSAETDSSQAVALGDFDGDGDLDQLVGNSNQANRVYRNDGGNAFTLVWSSAESDDTSSVAWGDYDNDGDLDQLVGNHNQANRVYRNDWNTSGSFALVWSSGEADNTYGLTWGDADADGDLDQLVANYGVANRLYRNDGGGVFTLVWSSAETDDSIAASFGDSDGDGDLDLLVANNAQPNRVYRNDGGFVYTLVWSSAETEQSHSGRWADYDVDGDLDQLVGNYAQPNRVYRNNGANVFAPIWVAGVSENNENALWGDTDGDGDGDFVSSNHAQASRVYRNNTLATNTAPTAPALTAEPDALSGSVKLEWTGSTDSETPGALLTYTLRVGTSPGGNEVMSGKIAAGPGNVGQSLSWSLNLSGSTGTRTYYWSVQAVDNSGFLTSSFAAEDSFVISDIFGSVWTSGEADSSTTVAWGDSDGDGDLDQLVGNANQPNRLYRNDGGGAFSLVWSSTETDATTILAWGDYDGDGDLDQLVGNYSQANRVYQNNGGNTFALVWSSAETDATEAVAWGDFDNDGDLDQLVGNNGANRVYRNDGGSAFALVWTSAEVDATSAVAWGDFDGDGDLDQVVGNNGVNRVYQNTGNGSFSLVWSSAETDGTQAVVWGDYDGDGDLDHAAVNWSQADRVYRNDGANAFTLVWTSAETEQGAGGDWGDYDGDGDLDLLVGNYAAPSRVYRNDGGGAFTLSWSSPLSENIYSAPWADMDGDGDLDFAAVNYPTQANRVYRNNLNPANTAPPTPTITAEPDALSGSVKLEWTSGGADDHTPAALITYNLRVGITPGGREIMSSKIPVGPGNVGQSLSWSLNLSASTGTRTYYWSVQAVDNTGFLSSGFAAEDSFDLSQGMFLSVWTNPVSQSTAVVAWGDYDNDGDVDILETGVGAPTRVYQNNGGFAFANSWTSAETDSSLSAAWGDYDGDGDLDIAVGNNGQANRIYRNDGGGTFTSAWTSADTDATFVVSWADFDNDGDLDLMAGNWAQANRLYRNDGGGVFTSAFLTAETDQTYAVDWADYDGDGDLDFSVANGGQTNRVYRNDWNTGSTFTPVWVSPDVNDDSRRLAWGDYDADGLPDLVEVNWFDPYRVYHNDGGGSFTEIFTSGSDSGLSVAWGDYDADGDLDFLAGNGGQSDRIFQNNGGGAFVNVYNTVPTDPFLVAWADGDGDGDLDFVSGEGPDQVFRNNLNPANTAPPTPTLTAEPDAFSGSINLQWSSGGADDHTPAALITYNLRVGTTPGGHEVMSAKIAAGPGNVGQLLSWSLNLSASTGTRTYYWSVQAVDNTAFLSSSFAAEDSFVINDKFQNVWTSTETDTSRDVEWADYDGDGDVDQLVANNGANRLYRNDGGGTFTLIWSSPESDNSYTAVWGDYDGDGDLDQLVANNTGQVNRVYRNDGASTFTLVWSTTETDNSLAASWADLDDDGDLDFAVANQNQANRVYRNNGNHTFSLVWTSAETDNSYKVFPGDSDGDGDLDLFVANGSTQANRLYRNDGNFQFTLAWSSPETEDSRTLALGDLDGDGDLDQFVVVWGNAADRVYQNNGANAFSSVWTSQELNKGLGVNLADFDGDGDLDAVVSGENQPSTVYTNNGGMTFSQIYSTSTTNVAVVPGIGDYDNDGDVDFALAHTLTIANNLYQNNLNHAQSPPTTPALNPRPHTVSGSVVISWSASTDTQTTDADLITYTLRVGASPGGHDVFSGVTGVGPGNTGQGLSHALNLSAGAGAVQYYWSVKAVDSAYSTSAFAAEQSFWVDGTGPTGLTALNEMSGSTDLDWSAPASAFSASWPAAADAETGLLEYSVSVGTTQGGADVYPWTSVGTVTDHTATGVTLLSGSTYFFNVRAINNVGVMSPILSADGVAIDGAAPFGGVISHENGWRNAATLNDDTPIAYTAPNDGGAGITLSASHTLQRRSATLTAGVCGGYGGWADVLNFSAAAASAGTVTDSFNLVANTCYQWQVVFRDDVDNALAVATASEVKVDVNPPTCAFTVLSESATTTWVAGSTLYFSNSAATSFAAEYSLSDDHSADAVDFPALGAPLNNFTGGGMDNSTPYSGTYNIGPTTLGMQDPVAGSNRPTCSDSAGNLFTATTNYGVAEDNAGPIGGAVSHLNGWLSASALTNDVTVNYTIGTDGGAGISAASGNQHTLQRLVAPMTAGACGAYVMDNANVSSFAANASVTSTVTDTYNLLADNCYQWQIVMRDNVGNETVFTAAEVLQTDATPPHTCNVSAISDSSLATWTVGNTIWYGNGGAGSYSVSVTLADNHNAASVSFPVLAGGFTNVTGGVVDTAAPFEQLYGTGPTTTGSEDPLAGGNVPVCYDGAGNSLTATNSYSLRQDITIPNVAGASVGHYNGWLSASQLTNDVGVSYTVGTDAGSGIDAANGIGHNLWRRVATLTTGTCGAWADDALVLSFSAAAGASGTVTDSYNLLPDKCYTWEVENFDNVSNSVRVATLGDVIKTDNTNPATCQVSGVATSGQFTWVNGVTGHYSALGAGTFDVTYTGTDAQVFGDISFAALGGGFANVTGGPGADSSAPYSQSYTVGATTTGSENPVAGANQPVCHDVAGNPTTATTNWALVQDTAAPTGGAISSPTSWTQTPTADNAIAYTVGQDVGGNNAGITSTSFNVHEIRRMVAPLTTASCGAYVQDGAVVASFAADGLSESSVLDTTDLASDQCYQWQLTMLDNVGNATTITTSQTLLVDTTGPNTCYVENVAEGSNYTWVSGSTDAYYSNLGPGNFTVSYSGSDLQSFAGINFPTLGGAFSNITGSGTDTTYPFQQIYNTGAGTTGTEAPVAGANMPVCSDSANNTTVATANYNLTADNTGPTSGSIGYFDGYTLDLVSARTISYSIGVDAGAGIAAASGNNHVIQRFVAPLTGDSCGAFVLDDANVATFGANALDANTTTDPDVLLADQCYSYHLIMADNVANTTVVSSSQVIRTDTTGPATCDLTGVSESTNNTWVSGSQVFYSALGAGTYSASYTGTDAHSFSHIIFPAMGGAFSNVTGSGNDNLAPYEQTYNTGITSLGSEDPLAGANRATCVDMAGNTTVATTNYSLIADNAGPTSGSVNHDDKWQNNLAADNTLAYSVGEDVGAANAGIHSTSANAHVLQRLVAPLSAGVCGAYGVDDANVATFVADALSQSTVVDPDDLITDKCYKWQLVQKDNVGNATTVSASQSIRTDTTGPGTCQVVSVSDSTLYTWVSGVRGFYSNLGAGQFTVTYTGTDAQAFSHIEFPPLSASAFVNVSGSAVAHAAAYTASYTTGASSTGTQDPIAAANRPVCYDTSGNPSAASANWSLLQDTTGPTGGSTSYVSGYTNNLTQDIVITYTLGQDNGAANAGIASTSGWLHDLERGEATMTAGNCGAYSWSVITSFAADALSTSAYTDTADMTADRCYQWRLTQRDNTGNATATTPTLTLKTDTTPPATCTLVGATKTSTNTWVNGATVYYSNQGAGSFTVESTGTDVHSFSHVIFPALTAPINNITGSGTDTAAPFTVSYATGASSFGDANPLGNKPTCVDTAGNAVSASTHIALLRDVTDPTGGSLSHYNGWQADNVTDQSVSYAIGADTGAGISNANGNGHVLQRLAAPLSAGNCGSYVMDNASVLSFSAAAGATGSVNDPYDRLGARCYTWQMVMKDNVGNNVTRTTTSAVKVDVTPPSAVSQLNDGLGADEFYASSNNTLTANWQPATDAESAQVTYSYSIGTAPGLTNVRNWTDLSTSTSLNHNGLTLTAGATYYVNVRAGNNAGLAGPVASTNGVLVDATLPIIPYAYDGPSADVDYQSSPEVLNVNWGAATSGASGLREYSLSVGTTPGGTELFGWTNVGLATSYTSTSLPLQNGTTYYASVRTVTNAGVLGPTRTTDGTLVDSVQPTIPHVNDGTTLSASVNDLDYTRQLTTLSSAWPDPVVGPSGVAGVVEFSYSIGTSPGAANVVNWTSNGLNKSFTRSNLTLVDGTTYFVSVRVTNPALVTSPARHSDGILADVTPPPLTLTSPPANFLTRVTAIPVTGTTESGTGVTVTGNGVAVPVTSGAVSGSVTVSEGLQVFTVVATDPAGNTTTLTRSIRVDLTLPTVTLSAPAANTAATAIGGQVAIVATVGDDVAVGQVKVEYGPGSTPTAYKQIGSTLTAAVSNQTIATWDTATLSGLYTLRLTGADTAGNQRVVTRQIYIGNQTSTPTSLTLAKNGWYLFSVPGQPVPSDPKKFISGKFNVRRWNPLSTGSAPLYNYQTEFTAGPGQGFWVRTYDNDVSLNFAFNVQDSTQTYVQTLYSGFNMLGTPFNRSIPVSSLRFRNRATGEVRDHNAAVLAGWVDSVFWGYSNGSYVQMNGTGTLAPYSAYFLKLNENLDLLVNPAGNDPSGVARIVRPPLPVHQVKVAATQNAANGRQYGDVDNLVGLMHTAAEGRDTADAEEPPPTEDFLMVFSQGVDREGKAARLGANYKPAAAQRGEEAAFTVVARANQPGPVNVTFTLASNENNAFATTITDLSTGVETPLTKDAPINLWFDASPAEGQEVEKHWLVKAMRLGGALSEISHSFEPGWRLVSFPIDAVPSKAADQLADDVKDLEIYQYYESLFTQVGKGEDVDLQAGLGYWLRLGEPAVLDLEGVLPAEDAVIEVPLKEGWNLVGNPFAHELLWGENIAVRHNATQQVVALPVAVQNGWLRSPLYKQAAQGGGYETGDHLLPYEGGFVLSQGDLTLLIKR